MKIYISSTYTDLKEQRKAAAEAVRELGYIAVAMEDYASTEKKPVDKCCQDVLACDIFVGIYAYRYGFIPANEEKSITHLEYEHAGKAGIPRLLFLVGDEMPWPRKYVDKKQQNIDKFRETLLNNHVVTVLSDMTELKFKITTAINDTLQKMRSDKQQISSPRIKIPLILPYLNDRSDQRYELEEVLEECRDNLYRQPLVCFVHGDEQECHDRFVEKMQSYLLPELLDPAGNTGSVGLARIDWPDACWKTERRFRCFERDLARKLTNKCDTEVNFIVKSLNARKSPLLIYCSLQVAGWQKNEGELINRWLRYWDDLPDLAIDKKLVVALCIKYKNTADMSPAMKRKYDDLNDRARQFITDLKFENFDSMNGLVFSELLSVNHTDIDDWIRNYADLYCDPEDLENKVDELYKKFDSKPIPMRTLATELKKLMQ